MDDFDELDVQTIVDRITRLKAALKLANDKSDKPVDVYGMFSSYLLFLTIIEIIWCVVLSMRCSLFVMDGLFSDSLI